MSDSPIPNRWPKAAGLKSRRKPEQSRQPTLDDNALMAQTQTQFSFVDFPDNAHDYKGTCIHAVNGVELVADAEGIVFWPAENALLVADLHLEKGSSFAKRGQLIPPYDTITTLRRLTACLEKWRPKRVIALGDSFHDVTASERLSEESSAQLQTLMKGRDWVWITGNHDPEPPVGLGGMVTAQLALGNLLLRHEPQIEAPSGEIAGHLHPKARLVRRGRSVRRSCFAASRDRMIMPSFGAYTGGLNVFDAAFAPLFDRRNFHALMRGDGQVYRIAASQLS